jgi:predicted outer membrane lipoprotein
MSRSGYSDDCDGWALFRWRGAVSQAIRGKRGQAMLGEMLQALDALPEPTLAAESLVTSDGEYCALGALGRARAMELESINPDDRESVAQAFGVAEALAAEIMDLNDRDSFDERIYFNFDVCGPMRRWESHRQLRWATDPKAGRIRWSRVRAWVASHIKDKP